METPAGGRGVGSSFGFDELGNGIRQGYGVRVGGPWAWSSAPTSADSSGPACPGPEVGGLW